MTQLLSGLIDLVVNLCAEYIPSYDFTSGTYDRISDGITSVVSFLVDVNCFVPLGDIATIILLTVAVRLFKFTLFMGNWIVRRIFDIIP